MYQIDQWSLLTLQPSLSLSKDVSTGNHIGWTSMLTTRLVNAVLHFDNQN